ncbi:MerR family transcriptional regulator [Pseudomarimonas arenosa]|uniref:MerR family transcriptional regulator n=1 Tax=Pseudomarimonas arenosa TaxID=2774145 RepID=A0AAW3ZH15_9GAMM|nr:MerR family transcriptional regulator [Pseudomarimonas arenosa]MBD8524282.1 MerR family transcriptional regulator [Pseudomarimonas arenosa]
MTGFTIGHLAKQAGVGIDTVRFYERSGLLQPAGRAASGYRRYGEAELQRLGFIRRAKELGFSLDEIAELLSLSERRSVAGIKSAAAEKLADIEARISDLRRIRHGLKALVDACPGHGEVAACPILNALGQPAKARSSR